MIDRLNAAKYINHDACQRLSHKEQWMKNKAWNKTITTKGEDEFVSVKNIVRLKQDELRLGSDWLQVERWMSLLQ